jgi:hypothetical protein
MRTVNPYLSAGSMVLRRLRWDLHPESWRSRQRLRKQLDVHSGQKAGVICNGPSLLKSNLSLLDGVFTFGLNKINLLFERSEFRPSCIVAVNPLVIEQNAAFYNETSIPLFLDSVGLRWVPPRPGISFLHSVNYPRFARDCSFSLWQGATVTYVALQLAFHMGFSEVALIGADHSFATKGPANKEVASGDNDLSHFDPRYFSGGVKWHLPDLPQSELGYSMARDAYEAAGRRIVNATEGGQLEIFERQSLSEFVAEPS